jgi:hypothetical protein
VVAVLIVLMMAAHDAWEASRKPEVKAIKRLSVTAPSL